MQFPATISVVRNGGVKDFVDICFLPGISAKIRDGWMKQVLNSPESLHVVTNPRDSQRYLIGKKIDIENYTIDDLHKVSGKETCDAKSAKQFYTVGDIWKMIISCAHKTGEPGVAFMDRINRDNPVPSLGTIEATNPCGEQPLQDYEACTLGSINLTKFVKQQDGVMEIDWEFFTHVRIWFDQRQYGTDSLLNMDSLWIAEWGLVSE